MLTIFCTAKPFKGRDGELQRNALKSWTLLKPRPEILLFGDEAGYAEAAKDLGLRRVPKVETNDRGLPLLSSMFAQADGLASHSLLACLDADILLLPGFLEGVKRVQRAMDRFLLVGQSRLIDVPGAFPFESRDWPAEALAAAKRRGGTHGSVWGIDYFVFPRGTFPTFPPFVVGRPGWDNWFIYHARSKKVPVIDGTRAIHALHQVHDYASVPGGVEEYLKGPDAAANFRIVGGPHRLFSVSDSTHILTRDGVRRAWRMPYVWRRLYNAPILHPRLKFLRPAFDVPLRLTRSLRARLGFRLSNFERIK